MIREGAESLFGANASPVAILLTHDHPDHAGSTLSLARRWHCVAYVHSDEMELATMDFSAYLSTVRKYANPLDRWIVLPLLHLMPKRARASTFAESSFKEVAHTFDPGAGIPGLPDWECIATPGHTGHISFFRPADRVLIAGDAVLTVSLSSLWSLLLWSVGRSKQGLSGPPWYATWNWQHARILY